MGALGSRKRKWDEEDDRGAKAANAAQKRIAELMERKGMTPPKATHTTNSSGSPPAGGSEQTLDGLAAPRAHY